MNFELSAEQQMIQKLVHEFADEEVAPEADERDRKKEFPIDVFKMHF